MVGNLTLEFSNVRVKSNGLNSVLLFMYVSSYRMLYVPCSFLYNLGLQISCNTHADMMSVATIAESPTIFLVLDKWLNFFRIIVLYVFVYHFLYSILSRRISELGGLRGTFIL